MKLKKTYKFALKTSFLITVFLTLLMSVFLYLFYTLNILHVLFFTFFTYAFSFLIIQFRVEKFIYKRINKIYKDLTLLESASFRKDSITTDMATLTRQIDKYAKDVLLPEMKRVFPNSKLTKKIIGEVTGFDRIDNSESSDMV